MEFLSLLNGNTWFVFVLMFGASFTGFAALGARLGGGRG